jgi:hypothetical protein
VQAVHIAHRRRGELGGIEIVETGEVDRDEVAADLLDVTPAERRHRAIAMRPRDELGDWKAVAGHLLARQQAERVRFHRDAPPAQLPAIGAVALAGALGEVDVGLVADFLAVAAAVIRLLHAGLPVD